MLQIRLRQRSRNCPPTCVRTRDQIMCLLDSRFCLFCPGAGQREGPSQLYRPGARSSLRDILSCQECHVTGQRAQSVMSFSGRGQGICLQGQSSCGQRGGVGGVVVSHVGWLFGTGEVTAPGVLARPNVEPRPPWNASPSPSPHTRGFLGHCSALGGSTRMQKRPGMRR